MLRHTPKNLGLHGGSAYASMAKKRYVTVSAGFAYTGISLHATLRPAFETAAQFFFDFLAVGGTFCMDLLVCVAPTIKIIYKSRRLILYSSNLLKIKSIKL